MKGNLLALFGIFNFGLTFSQGMLKDERLGLVSYLTTVKYMSEYKMTKHLSEENYINSQDSSKKIQSEYNAIMINVNRLINQLSVDLITKNKLCEYRKINKFVNKRKSNLPKKFSSYVEALKEIDKLAVYFLTGTTVTTETNITTRAMPALPLSDISGIGTLAETSITSARDFRATKINDIITILKDLKLKSISDLSKKDESE
jgi:hypothetical protein